MEVTTSKCTWPPKKDAKHRIIRAIIGNCWKKSRSDSICGPKVQGREHCTGFLFINNVFTKSYELLLTTITLYWGPRQHKNLYGTSNLLK
ncbi:unnamed protein product [Tenebrio molitor]|nr:unnamed protein product [Tenebrio molitor]